MKSRSTLRARLAVGLAVSALLATGCASSTDADNESDGGPTGSAPTTGGENSSLVAGMVNMSNDGTPTKGGILRIADYAEPASQDPARAYASGPVGGNTLAAMYDTLVRYDWDTGSWVPQMAESVTQTKPTTWTLKLKKDVTFSDGTPLDADAVIGSIDRYLASYGYNFVVWQSNVTEYKKVDATTVEFTTRSPWATFPNMLAQGFGMIVAPAAYQDPKAFEPIGAGPFTLKDYKPKEKLEVVANEKYWNGRPNLDGITWTWPGADQSKLDAADNGDIDGMFLREPKVVAKALEAKKGGMLFVSGAGATLSMNQRDGRPGSYDKVREAINLAMDPVVYYKRNGDPDAVPNKQITPRSSPWFTEVEVATPNDEAARAALAEAKKEGYDGTITYTHMGDPVSTAAATNIKAMLEKVGFKVSLDPMQSIADQTKKIYMDYDYDIAMSAISAGQEDPYTAFAGPLTPKSPTNMAGIEDPAVMPILTELAAAQGPEDGKEAMADLEKWWQKELPAVNLADGNLATLFNDNVHGVTPTTQSMMLFDKAWITK